MNKILFNILSNKYNIKLLQCGQHIHKKYFDQLEILKPYKQIKLN